MKRKLIVSLLSAGLLLCVYLFQDINLLGLIAKLSDVSISDRVSFIIRKTLRLVLNDLACMLLIWVWFPGKQFIRLALAIFLLEVLVLLPLYFVLKLSLEGPTELSSPLLSQFHRLLVNPLLMLLMIAGFLYQKIKTKSA